MAAHSSRPARFTGSLSATRRRKLFLESLEERRVLAAGDLDPTFGTGGLTTTELYAEEWRGSILNATAIQPDGKIVAAGDGGMVRFTAEGLLDTSFGNGGRVSGVMPNYVDVAVQGNGKIIVVGAVNGDFAVARFMPDGKLDPSFDQDGVVYTSFGTEGDQPTRLAIQPNGQIVVAGKTENGTSVEIAAARYNLNGSLDLTFSGDGKFTGFGANGIAVSELLIQNDGKILILGGRYSTSSGTSVSGAMLARLTPAGAVDSSFGTSGLSQDSSIQTINAGDLASDGKIVVMGRATISRFTSNGVLDTTFATNGIMQYPNASDGNAAITLLPDGRILFFGYIYDYSKSPSTQNAVMSMFRSDGTLDTSFGSGGTVVQDTSIGTAESFSVVSLSRLASGKFLVGATGYKKYNQPTMGLIRLNADGSSDPTFAADGTVSTESAYDSHTNSQAIDVTARLLAMPGGGYIVAEDSNSYPSSEAKNYSLTRFTAQGSIDRSWGTNGHAGILFPSTNPYYPAPYPANIRDLELQSDGKVLAVGQRAVAVGSGYEVRFLLQRYLADGTPDSSFGTGGYIETSITRYLFNSYDEIINYASFLKVQNDGKILLAGPGAEGTFIARFDAAGNLDLTFGNQGIAPIPGVRVTSLLLLPDGKIVASTAGEFSVSSGSAGSLIHRLLADGTYDTTFDSDGTATALQVIRNPYTNEKFLYDYSGNIESLALQADGKLLYVAMDRNTHDRFQIGRFNIDGSPDFTFGPKGLSTIEIKATLINGSGHVGRLVVLPDQSILVGGSLQSPELQLDDDYYHVRSYALIKFTPAGTLDYSFDSDGVKYITPAEGANFLSEIAVREGNRIAVVGVNIFRQSAKNVTTLLSEFDFNGNPVTTFGDGETTITIGSGDDNATQMRFGRFGSSSFSLTDVAYSYNNQRGGKNSVVKAPLFAEIGIAESRFDSSEVTEIGTDSLGTRFIVNRTAYGPLFARPYYDPSGFYDGSTHDYSMQSGNVAYEYDTTFPSGTFGSSNDTRSSPAAIALPEGRMIIAHSRSNGSNLDFALARSNPRVNYVQGIPDIATLDIPSPPNLTGDDIVTGTILQPDGKIVVSGYSIRSTGSVIALARFNADLTIDSAFGSGGWITTGVGTGDAIATGITLQADGKIIVSGYAKNGAANDFIVLRYLTNGALDSTFGAGGKALTAFWGGEDTAAGVAIQPDGKILVAGTTASAKESAIAIARYNVNGTLDTTFDGDGRLTLFGGMKSARASDFVLQPDGKLVISGQIHNGANYDALVLRLLNDPAVATLDASGNLTFTDSPTSAVSNVNVSYTATEMIIESINVPFGSAPNGGTLSADKTKLTLPLASVTGKVRFNLGSGDDSLSVNSQSATLDFIPNGGFEVDGGSGSDQLRVFDYTTRKWNLTGGRNGLLAVGTIGSIAWSDFEKLDDENGKFIVSPSSGPITGVTIEGTDVDFSVPTTYAGPIKVSNDTISTDTSSITIASDYYRTNPMRGLYSLKLTGGSGVNRFDINADYQNLTLNSGGGTDTLVLGVSNKWIGFCSFAGTGSYSYLHYGARAGDDAQHAHNLLFLNGSFKTEVKSTRAEGTTFDFSDWYYGATVQGQSSGVDLFSVTRNFSYATINDSEFLSGRNEAIKLSNIKNARITGGAAGQRLDAGGWTGALSFAGAGGNDTLGVIRTVANYKLTDSALNYDESYVGASSKSLLTLPKTNAALSAIQTMKAYDVELISISANAGNVDSTFDVGDWRGNGEFFAGNGNDVIVSNKSAATLLQADATVGATTLSQTMKWRSNGNIIEFTQSIKHGGIDSIRLTGGAIANRYDVSGWTGGGTIDGGGGIDTLVSSKYIDQTLADTSLKFATKTINLASIERADLSVADANGRFINAKGFTLGPITLTGNAGNDTLWGGVFGDTLRGLGGHDMLVGNGGYDTLQGDAGNDVLIGGAGVDALDGGAGEDILIGGTTSYDSNNTALDAILAAWANTAASYAARITTLTSTGVGSGNQVRLVKTTTVQNESAVDSFAGGADLDWFWADSPGSETLSDRLGTETVSDVV